MTSAGTPSVAECPGCGLLADEAPADNPRFTCSTGSWTAWSRRVWECYGPVHADVATWITAWPDPVTAAANR